jgi:hypothetical protein
MVSAPLNPTGPSGYSRTGVRFAVLLFDIDGTLVHAGGAGRRSRMRLATSTSLRGGGRRLACRLADGTTDRPRPRGQRPDSWRHAMRLI